MTILVEKYRPLTIDSFAGLEDAKLRARSIVTNPRESSWLFLGGCGTGKKKIAHAIAEELKAELHHLSSQNCTVAAVRTLRDKLAYAPMFGCTWHLVIIDEADEMSPEAQNAWLSILDSTNRPARTIFIFTANSTEALKDRFVSRNRVVKFSTYGIAKDAIDLLARVWEHETGNASAPNFARIVKESNNNIRASLQVLESHIEDILFA